MKEKKTLWTGDFTRITLASLLSIIGGVFTLFEGALGEVMPLRTGVVLLCAIDLAVMLLFICLPARHNRVVYEAVREKED